MKNIIKEQILTSAEVKNEMVESCVSDIEKAAVIMINCNKKGGKILWCGNGGSAADA